MLSECTPSTDRGWPVTYEDDSDSNHNTASTTSSTLPGLSMGIVSDISFFSSGLSAMLYCQRSVIVTVGATALIRSGIAQNLLRLRC